MAAQKWHSKGTGKNWKCVHEHGRGSGAAPASVCAALRVLTDAQNATKTDIKKERCSVPPCFRLWLPVVILPGGPANKAKNSTKKGGETAVKCHQKRLETAKKCKQKKERQTAEKVGQKRPQKYAQKRRDSQHSGKSPENGCMKRKAGCKSSEKFTQKKTPARGRGDGHLLAGCWPRGWVM